MEHVLSNLSRDVGYDSPYYETPPKRRITKETFLETASKKLKSNNKNCCFTSRQQRIRTCKLSKSIKSTRHHLKKAVELSYTQLFTDFNRELDSTSIVYFKTKLKHSKIFKPLWTPQNLTTIFALFKNGPKAYNVLRNLILMPNKSTIEKLMKKLPFDAGINEALFSRYKELIKKKPLLYRSCVLMFQNIAITRRLSCNAENDTISGYVDLGPNLGRRQELADHAVVFMIRGVASAWKQPVAYYFTGDQFDANLLKKLVKEVITALQDAGFEVLGTVCDLKAHNRVALRLLRTRDDTINNSYETQFRKPYFILNGKKIVTPFDTPHLLKATRNTFFNYNISYSENKCAKSAILEQTLRMDKNRDRRYSFLNKIDERYLNLPRKRLKNKVSVAAQVLSYKMGSTISHYTEHLPNSASDTAAFVVDIDTLFDSLNATRLAPDDGKPLRRFISRKSGHFKYWKLMERKINSWTFTPISENNGKAEQNLPIKHCWLITINGVREIFTKCLASGMKHLQPRFLNQDPLEDMLAAIKQRGADETRPDCEEFVRNFKTCILSDSMSPKRRYWAKCERDKTSFLLDDLSAFLSDESGYSDIPSTQNEMFNLHAIIEEKRKLGTSGAALGACAAACFSSFNSRKYRIFECDRCQNNIISNQVQFEDPDLLTQGFNASFLRFVNDVCDIVINALNEYGHVLRFKTKIKLYLTSIIDFSWFLCLTHSHIVFSDMLDSLISFIIAQYCSIINKELKGKVKIFKSSKEEH